MANDTCKPWIGLVTRNIREENGCLVVSGVCLTRLVGGSGSLDTGQVRIDVASKRDAARISFGRRFGLPGPKGARVNTYRIEIDLQEAREWDIQNKLLVIYKDQYEGTIVYDVRDMRKGHNKNGPLFIHDGVTSYLRQNKNNRLFLVVRDTNRYDDPAEQKRLERAKKNSKELADKDIILMYEKNCSRYEESASVLYEKLIDLGYDNVYYIVDTSIPAVQELPEKYKKNLIEKDSDRHLEYFFACNKFISTETIDHSLQLRIANKSAQDKITGEGLMYVFLQHGVMYMVSLNSAMRVGFKQKTGYKLHRTVVSSEAEAKHFIDLAGMDRDDLYITGLAKFDKCYRNEGADKIIIMPTWRRWETNQAKKDVESTGYFRMIETMYNAVPEDKRDKVVILPHPLMAERFRDEEGGLGGSITIADSYDRVLRNCSLLITDYSSIAYDAYYRGANVVFYWKDKNECMEHYGEGTFLMLNEDNVFGEVCMNGEEITKAVEELYNRPQRERDLERYNKIVEFHDGRNSERIIEKLIEDGVIERK